MLSSSSLARANPQKISFLFLNRSDIDVIVEPESDEFPSGDKDAESNIYPISS